MNRKQFDLRGKTVYQVFLRNYAEKSPLKKLVEDLEGLQQKGVDFLYLSPIHPIGKEFRKGQAGSAYSILNHCEIDESIGTWDEFKTLIERAHELGLAVLMDMVFHHVAYDAVEVKQHPDWFLKDKYGNPTRKVESWSDVADFNFEEREVWDFHRKTLRTWFELGVDGFRFDVASMIPLDFWIFLRQEVDPERRQIWIAESIEKGFIRHLRNQNFCAHSDPELHRVFDVTYDCDGMEYIKSFLKGEAPIDAYLNHLFVQETLYPQNAVKLRFLENHDTPRAAAQFGNTPTLKNWTVFYQMIEGLSLTFMGQEYALEQPCDLFERSPIDWTLNDREFENFFLRVVALRKQILLDSPTCEVKKLAEGVLLIERWGPRGHYQIVVNLLNKIGEISIPFSLQGENLMTFERVDLPYRMGIPRYPLIVRCGA